MARSRLDLGLTVANEALIAAVHLRLVLAPGSDAGTSTSNAPIGCKLAGKRFAGTTSQRKRICFTLTGDGGRLARTPTATGAPRGAPTSARRSRAALHSRRTGASPRSERPATSRARWRGRRRRSARARSRRDLHPGSGPRPVTRASSDRPTDLGLGTWHGRLHDVGRSALHEWLFATFQGGCDSADGSSRSERPSNTPYESPTPAACTYCPRGQAEEPSEQRKCCHDHAHNQHEKRQQQEDEGKDDYGSDRGRDHDPEVLTHSPITGEGVHSTQIDGRRLVLRPLWDAKRLARNGPCAPRRVRDRDGHSPSRSSIFGSRRHFGRTLTWSSRYTGCPTSASTSGRARVPISRTIAPFLPTRIPFWDSVST